jgi:hypothetical protein
MNFCIKKDIVYGKEIKRMKYVLSGFDAKILKLANSAGATKSETLPSLEGGFESLIRSAEIAGILGLPVCKLEQDPEFQPGDEVILARYIGPEIPVGSYETPYGGKFTFLTTIIK